MVVQILLCLGLFSVVVWWLLLPTSKASIAVSANSGSITLQILCGERLVWDLPTGRIGHRSALPGNEPTRAGNVTLTLTTGARVRIESVQPGGLNIVVDRSQGIARGCAAESVQPFQVAIDGGDLTYDPMGFTYSAAASQANQVLPDLSLPLSGHIVLGQAVQQGGGWPTRVAGILESGTVILRVIPVFSDERVTLNTEHLDEGSLLDTHACLDTRESLI